MIAPDDHNSRDEDRIVRQTGASNISSTVSFVPVPPWHCLSAGTSLASQTVKPLDSPEKTN
jgi:hypothetical protein